MSVFNIATSESRDYESTSGWAVNSAPTTINQNKASSIALSVTTIPSYERYSWYSKISSSFYLDLQNQEIKKDYFAPLAILIRNDTSAIRQNLYNEYTGEFAENFPTTTKYFVPTQQTGTSFNTTKQPKNLNPTLFLPENYLDEFATKDTILSAVINGELSDILNTTVYSAQCDDSCASSFLTHFIQPSYDSENTDYNDADNYGVSFNDPTGIVDSISIITIEIKKNNETIITVSYNPVFANTEIVVKHPDIVNYQKFILPASDSEINA